MTYRNLKVTNFRGIKSIEINDLNLINVFVGKNNSGKSSILEAIFLLTGISNPELILRIDSYRRLIHNEENDFRFVFYNLKYQNIPELHADLILEDSYRKLKIKPSSTHSKSDDAIEISLSKTDFGSDSASSFLANSINSLILEGEIKRKHSPKKTIKSSVSIERKNLNNLDFRVKPPREFKEDLYGIFLNDQILNIDTQKRVEKLIIEKKKNYILETLQIIDKSIIDITTGSNNLIYFDIGAERLLPSNLLGDGVNKMLAIISSLNELKNGILLIDEIDNGLHHSTIEILWKLIFELSVENNNQIFVTSHSIDLLKKLINFVDTNKSDTSYSTLVNCYSVSKVPGNEIKAYKYDYEELKYSILNNIELRDSF